MPTVQFQLYSSAVLSILNKEVDFDGDTLKVTLHTSTYSPNINTHRYVSDLTNEVATTGGYTTGGATVAGTVALTVANSWGSAAGVSTSYTLGQVRRPSTGNGFLYRVIVAGTTGGTAPTWPTVVGQTVTDGTITWANIGSAINVLNLTNATLWSGFSASFRYAVLSDRTPGTAATQPLIGVWDFGSTQSGGSGTFDFTTPIEGIYTIPVG